MSGLIQYMGGFAVSTVTPDLARRQLQISLGMIGIVTAVTLALSSITGASPLAAASGVQAENLVQQPTFVSGR